MVTFYVSSFTSSLVVPAVYALWSTNLLKYQKQNYEEADKGENYRNISIKLYSKQFNLKKKCTKYDL